MTINRFLGFKSNLEKKLIQGLSQNSVIIEVEPQSGLILGALESDISIGLAPFKGKTFDELVDQSGTFVRFKEWALSHHAVQDYFVIHTHRALSDLTSSEVSGRQGRAFSCQLIGEVEDLSANWIVRLQPAETYQLSLVEQGHKAQLALALLACQTNIILVDNNFTILYLNDFARLMLEANEPEIQKRSPNFSASHLIGKSLDIFDASPPYQLNTVKALELPYRSQIKIGDLLFDSVVTPWRDEAGYRLGTLVEWCDKTQERRQQDAESLIAAENLRIRQALEVCDVGIMLTDPQMNIIYLNHAVKSLLSRRQRDINQSLPGFDAETVLGKSLSVFAQDSSQGGLLSLLQNAEKTDLIIGELVFGLVATPIISPEGSRLGTVVEWKDKTEEVRAKNDAVQLAQERARIKQALDAVTTNVMIADKDANIVYMNTALVDMMHNAEADLKKALPHFNAGDLMGKSMDIFHKDPSHQRNIIRDLKQTYRGKAEVAGRYFNVIATPVFDGKERLGTVVEWADKTAEVSLEKEVNVMLQSVMAGDFTRQLPLDNKVGFFADLSKGLNSLVSTTEVALNDMLRMLGAMAKGDLSERITRDYQGSFAQLKHDANATAEVLTEIIGKIRLAAGSISTAANEIAQGNADLSQRTEEQASSLEETAASMEEMTSTVKQSANNAQEANRFSEEASQKARKGGSVVAGAVKAMEDINTASKRISDIIGVIDEIAFQTNLLALNAAVEAARAGEQGRGFAVVAGEVRNLAQRSAGAAKEIKELIRDSVTKVEYGRGLVNESGTTLSEIVQAVEKVSGMMKDIANTTAEQSTGIEQVNTAIGQMDEMTQQNAALVEQASAAGQAMADQARSLAQVVEFFSIQQTATGSVSPAASQRQSGSSFGAGHQGLSRVESLPKKTVKPSASPRAPAKASVTKTPLASHHADDEWEEF